MLWVYSKKWAGEGRVSVLINTRGYLVRCSDCTAGSGSPSIPACDSSIFHKKNWVGFLCPKYNFNHLFLS